MPTANAFLIIGAVIALSSFLGAWFSFLRFPLILAYIITGIIAGPFLSNDASHQEIFKLMQELGLSFLLFLIGLEIKVDDLKQFGSEAIKTALVQIVATFALAFLLSSFLSLGALASFYIALGLTFSSTVIVVKILTEKRDFDSLHGKISVAILLVQDLVAIGFLVILSGINVGGRGFNLASLLITLLVGASLVALIYFLQRRVLPYLFERLARNLELLFLSSIAWLFLVVAAFASVNFSIEIGAFMAGIGLASLQQEHQIAARIHPLRDFFVVLFFIVLGSQIALDFNFSILWQALVFSLFVLLVKPLVVMVTLGRLGLRRRTSFMVGLSLAQVSEFSLVVLFLALRTGQVDREIVNVVTLTALITIAVSSYGLFFATKIFRKIEKQLKILEVKDIKIEKEISGSLDGHFVLVGSGRLGLEILKQLKKQNKDVLVVDFNPSIVKVLKEMQVDYLFGDITDPDIWEEAQIDKASLIISTVFDPEDTEEILTNIQKFSNKPTVFVTAAERDWAVKFYQQGADYVIVPRILSGHQVAHLLTPTRLEEIREGHIKKEHLEELRETMKKLAL